MLRAPLAALSLALILSGCARMSPGLGFDDAATDIQSRTGAQARWDRAGPEDQEARDAVQQLLAAELTADAAVQVALLNNPELQATYEELDIAQADLVRAGLLRNPIFTGELRFDTAGGGTGIALDITQDFLSLLTIPLRRSRADAAFQAAKARVTRAAVDTAFDTRAAFYRYQAAEEAKALRETLEQSAAASAELARRLHQAGNTRELDLLTQQAQHEQARLDTELAAAQVAHAREQLNVLMGLPGPQANWSAPPRLPHPPPGDEPHAALEQLALDQSLELAEARAQINQAAAAARLARPLAWLEGSELGVGAERETEGGWEVGPSLSIPIPIFDSGGASSGEAAARLRQAVQRYHATAIRTRAAARLASENLRSARARVEQHQRSLLPLHDRIVKQSLLQYNAMQISPFQLLQAQQGQVSAAASSVEALRDYWTAHADLQRIIAGAAAPMTVSAPAARNTAAPRTTGEH
jgi:cobalt-zinc-cadmium efflux system outer membrane protein